ncbi:hypothetical protein HYPSUDRAFT_115895, partial [Hypholoma sublateritium FD-334 SS-4]
RKFDIVKLIHSSPILYGRGTRVWIVKDNVGKFYILKDSWIISPNSTSEIEMIKHIEKTINDDPEGFLYKHSCPTYFIGQECVHSTDMIRGRLDKPATRLQRRIVTGTIGDPITSFRSRAEFVSVCLDLVNVLEFLSKKAHVIHGDLSINNILINRSQRRALAGAVSHNTRSVPSAVVPSAAVDSPHQVYGGTMDHIECSGMLIDCDFMRFQDQPSHQTSGTLPFMPLESLWMSPNTPFTHRAGHDLEGLLSTIITVCNYTSGPAGQLRAPLPGDEDMLINVWFTKEKRRYLACLKSIHLEAFDEAIQPSLPKYWEDFAPFIQRLIDVT